ncbi:hypothetical protein CYMTET_7980 [Cymbomonas tetramitiformis]|uniref:Uncharacterized protein n=1 Tax=Cymbomonas tetramitiformis TaxID=36881 RepID=A0AAE0GUK6_9CHLO|nr:hypothetical protein CYMTET_7980 [Cymbomonas tetramitiformis]
MADNVLDLVSDEEDGETQKRTADEAFGAGPSGTGGNQQPVPMQADAGADVKKLLQTFAVEATLLGDKAASTLDYKALQQKVLNARIGVTKITGFHNSANSGPEFTPSFAKAVLLFGIEHDPDINNRLAPACRTMIDKDKNLTVISENCPGPAVVCGQLRTHLVIVFKELLKYTEALDPDDAMKYRKPTCIFMQLLAAHEAPTTEVQYMHNVFEILRDCKVTSMQPPQSRITWKYLLAWMYVVAFHVSRMHEKEDNEDIFAGWLSNGALDLVDARIVRGVLEARTEKVIVVAGTAHVENVVRVTIVEGAYTRTSKVLDM